MQTCDPIVVAGGGIGGLALAITLGRRGWPVCVLEQASELGAVGYGLQLGPNAFHMFERIGLRESVLREGDRTSVVLMFDGFTGAEVTRVPTGASFVERFKQPYVVIHRSDLHRVLLDACTAIPTIELRPGVEVSGYDDAGDHVMVRCSSAPAVRGSALVGADGLRSRVRAQLCGDSNPTMTGYVAHRSLVPMSDVPSETGRDDVRFWGGPGFHVVTYPLRHGTVLNIVGVFATKTYAQKLGVDAHRAEFDDAFQKTHPSVRAVLATMNLERRWSIADRDPIRHWHRGRVTLLGDAAHGALQSLAQGACMAIEDGVCLGELIHLAEGDVAHAFSLYEATRRVRTARVILEGRRMWEMYHSDGIVHDAWWQVFAERTEPDVFRCLAWLYDGFKIPTGSPS